MLQKTQNHFLKFSIHLSVRKSWENYRQIYGKSKASLWRNLSTRRPPKLFRTILCFVALVYKSYFFQKSRYAEIIQHQILIQTLQFLTRLPTRQEGVKKTVTRSILQCMVILIWFGKIILLLDVQHGTFNKNIYGINNINH